MSSALAIFGLAVPSGSSILKFALTSLAILVIPGPSVLFVISRGITLGRKAGVLTVAGNTLGAFTQMACVAVGLGAVVAKSITAYNVVKYLGAGYLIYLGVQAFRHRHDTNLDAAVDEAPKSLARIVREGYVVGLTNPKLIVYSSATLPQFVDRSRGAVPGQMLVLAAIFTVLAFASDGTYAMLAGTARTWFVKSPKRISTLAGAGGLAIVGLGVNLALSHRKD